MDRHPGLPGPRAGPVRAFRDRYVAHFVGVSYDLAPGVVGVHPAALRSAPELPGREVTVSCERAPRTPLGARPTFTVVALTRLMRNASELALEGGVVFSSFDLEDSDASAVLARMQDGETVFLNAAVERLRGDVVKRPFDGAAC